MNSKKRDKKVKMQSATEYLMTYGWSILLVAVVLAAMFSLGIFNNNSALTSSNSCLAQPGFLCSKPVLNNNGVVNVTVGESSGSYTVTGVGCTNSSAPPTSFVAINPVILRTGQAQPLNFLCPFVSKGIGSSFAGQLWIQYTTSGSTSTQTSNLGGVSLRVSTTSAIGGVPSFYFTRKLGSIGAFAAPFGIAITPNGQEALVTDSYWGTVSIINLATNAITYNAINLASNYGPYSIAITPNGTRAVVADNGQNRISILNLVTNSVVTTINVGAGTFPWGVAITPDGSQAIVTYGGSSSSKMGVVNIAAGTVTNTYGMSLASPDQVVITPNGTTALIQDSGWSRLFTYNIPTNTIVNALSVGGSLSQSVAVTPNGTLAVVPNYFGNSVSTVNIGSNSVASTLSGGFGSSLYGIAMAPSGDALVLAYGSNNVIVMNVASNTILSSITVGSGPANAAVTPSGTQALVVDRGDGTISIIG